MTMTEEPTATEAPAKEVGKARRRKEDARLITGKTMWTDNMTLPGMLHAAIVRSPEANATFGSIDTSEAAAQPGVVAVLTAEVDRGDPRVRHRAPDDGEVQHAGQDHVVGPGRLPGDEARVFLAPACLPDLLLRRRGGRRLLDHGHDCAPDGFISAPPISLAACCTARTMFW